MQFFVFLILNRRGILKKKCFSVFHIESPKNAGSILVLLYLFLHIPTNRMPQFSLVKNFQLCKFKFTYGLDKHKIY